MLLSLLISLYYTSLICFSFVFHPISCCILLLVGAVSSSIFVYLFFGFSWYLVLFCLVYVGGVYVLFIYVSVFSPNIPYSVGGSIGFSFPVFLLMFILFGSLGQGSFFSLWDFSHYLCSFSEGFTYCVFCLVMMVSFVVVSLVGGGKSSFYR